MRSEFRDWELGLGIRILLLELEIRIFVWDCVLGLQSRIWNREKDLGLSLESGNYD